METAGSGTVVNNFTPTIDAKKCSGCGRCVSACFAHIITLETVKFHKSAVITYPDRCTVCGQCIAACPIAALTI